MDLKIVTRTNWPSFKNVAIDIREALKDVCTCTISDWKQAKPGGKTLVIGTLDSQTLTLLSGKFDPSEVLFYATTEGLCRLDSSIINIAERLKVVAVSGFVRQMIEQLGIPVEGVVHHGVDMNNTRIDPQFKKTIPVKNNGTIYLTVSANHPRKGLDHLLEAFRRIELQDQEAFLILHSQPQGHYDLEGMLRSLDLQHVWLTDSFGRITQVELNTLYEMCTIYVQPSESEGFGLPVLEAFRFDKPSIAVDTPPFNEIIDHGANGILIPGQGYRWLNYDDSMSFKLSIYSNEDLARAMSTSTADRILLANMRRQIKLDKWNWNSRKLYPELLEYLN